GLQHTPTGHRRSNRRRDRTDPLRLGVVERLIDRLARRCAPPDRLPARPERRPFDRHNPRPSQRHHEPLAQRHVITRRLQPSRPQPAIAVATVAAIALTRCALAYSNVLLTASTGVAPPSIASKIARSVAPLIASARDRADALTNPSVSASS